MKFTKIFSGRALYTEENKIWVARGMRFWAIDYTGRRISPVYLIGTLKQKLLSWHRLSRQLLREGIHHLLPLDNGNFFVVAKRRAYLLSSKGEELSSFSGFAGNKPGHQGVCKTPDGTIFFGEYTLNTKRLLDTKLYRSTDGGYTFQTILVLPKNKIRHIHFIKYDPYEKCLWLGTGDEDFECTLMRSDDNGNTWRLIGQGSQNWRAIGICFTPTELIWGTDAGSVPDKNYLIKMNRQTEQITTYDALEGPCHGCASFLNGMVFISTGVEGGENELDNFARLKKLQTSSLETVFIKKKDFFPLILQYGVFRFPLGTETTENIVFTTMGLQNSGELVYYGQ